MQMNLIEYKYRFQSSMWLLHFQWIQIVLAPSNGNLNIYCFIKIITQYIGSILTLTNILIVIVSDKINSEEQTWHLFPFAYCLIKNHIFSISGQLYAAHYNLINNTKFKFKTEFKLVCIINGTLTSDLMDIYFECDLYWTLVTLFKYLSHFINQVLTFSFKL